MAVVISSSTTANGNASFTLTASVCLCDMANANSNNGITDVYLPAPLSLITDCEFSFNQAAGEILIFTPSANLFPLLQYSSGQKGISTGAYHPVRYVYIGTTWCLYAVDHA